jgi:hypothetical protein
VTLRITALDPGGTTGVAVLDWDSRTIPAEPDMLVATWQIGFDDMPEALWQILGADRPTNLLAMERFVISPRTISYSRQPEALYVIGGGLFLAKIARIPVRLQGAKEAKQAYPNGALKGWNVKGPHARDALRHALLACHGA